MHPKILPLQTSCNLATAQGSSLTNFGKKNQLSLVPTRTKEQNKLLTKPLEQTFYITDIKHKIVEIPFISKYNPTTFILNSKIHLKDKYTRMKNTSPIFFQRKNKQHPFLSKFYPRYNQERKQLKPLAEYVYNVSISHVHQYNMKQNKQ